MPSWPQSILVLQYIQNTKSPHPCLPAGRLILPREGEGEEEGTIQRRRMRMEATGLAQLVPGLAKLGGGLSIGLGALGTGIGMGVLVGKALEGMARQPESA